MVHMVFAADAHLADGQLLREEPAVNREKSLELQEETRMPTVSSKERQNIHPLYILTMKGNICKGRLIIHRV
jgi:hypothetical protein